MPTPQHVPAPHSAQSHRFHLLDALRGILALLVVYRHSPAYLTTLVGTKDIFLAVDFFFCLSGFVIAYAYEDRLRTKLCVGDFAMARLIRFYPTFLVGTLLSLFAAVGPDHMLSQIGGHQRVAAALPSLLFLPSIPLLPGYLLFPLNMSAWTLLIELLANLAYALLIRGRRAVDGALLGVCIASLVVLVFAPRALDSGSTWPGAYVGMARMGFSFPMGVFVFRFWKHAPLGGLRRTRGVFTAVAIVTLLLAAILLPTPFSGQRGYQLAVITLLLPALIFFGADIRLGRVGTRLCAALGELSYPLYIVHLPLLGPLYGSHIAHLAQHSSMAPRILVPVYVLLLAVSSWALRIYFDAPLGGWLTRRWIQYRRSATSRSQTSLHLPTPYNRGTVLVDSTISGG